MTQAVETKKSTISLWRNDKVDSKVRASGQIQLTPELLAQLQAETPDSRGYINARVVIFKNNSDNPKAPTSTGYIELPQPNNLGDNITLLLKLRLKVKAIAILNDFSILGKVQYLDGIRSPITWT